MRIVKINNNFVSLDYYIFFGMMLASFLVPQYISAVFPVLGTLMSAISLVLILLFLGLNFKKINFPFVFLTNSFLLWVLVITFCLNKRNTFPFMFQEWKTLLLSCVVCCVVRSRKEISLSFLLVIRDMTFLFFALDVLILLIFRNGLPNGGFIFDGIGPYSLYGNVNATIRSIFPGILCSIIFDCINKRKYGFITLMFFVGYMYIFLFVYHMVTGFVALVILILWCLFYKIVSKKLKLFYLIYVILLGFVEYGIISLVTYGSGWITHVALFFGKSTDFSGRYFVWRRAILLIKESPFWGQGFIQYDSLRALLLNGYGAHNYYFDIGINGGLVGQILFVIVLLCPLVLMKKKRVNKLQYVLLGGWISLISMLLSEPLRGWEFLFIPILCAFLVMNHDSNVKDGQL